MSISSITIRLDFSEGSPSGLSSSVSLQGEAPTPMSGVGSGLVGVTQAGLPTPLPLASLAAAAAQAAPTPMSGIGGMSVTMNAPPVPSPDITSTRASGMTDDVPRPEGEPAAVKKKSAGEN